MSYLDHYQCLSSEQQNEIVREGPCPVDGLLRGPSAGWDPLQAKQIFRGRRERPYVEYVRLVPIMSRYLDTERWSDDD